MLTISLIEFIKTGNFGTITLGALIDEVIEQFGEDHDFGDFGETQIIKYDWYEFFYWTDTRKIFGIQNDHLEADCENHADMIYVSNNKWKLDVGGFLRENENIAFREVKQMLEEENIPYVIEPAYEGCDELIIRCVESNVQFDFIRELHFAEFDQDRKFKGFKITSLNHQDEYALNGIRLFNLER
jgi:hypothetical protein